MTHETLVALFLNLANEKEGKVELPFHGCQVTVTCETYLDEYGDLVQGFSWWVGPSKDSGHITCLPCYCVFPSKLKWRKKAAEALALTIECICEAS